MPYESPRQSRFIHAKAAEGVPWAKKFVADAHGTHVKKKSIRAMIGKPKTRSRRG